MSSKITELFGYNPQDKSHEARQARLKRQCPFIQKTCVKTLRDGAISGVCTLTPITSGPVICCPIRLYSGHYKILRDVANQAFGIGLQLVIASGLAEFSEKHPGQAAVAVFGKRWGKELRLPNRSKKGEAKTGGYFVDWILAHIDAAGTLVSFVAVEVQSIDTTGNYQAERSAHLEEIPFAGSSTAGFNWENVNKRILLRLSTKATFSGASRCAGKGSSLSARRLSTTR